MSDLRPGYQQTEVGVIPEDWDARSIRSLCQLINGRGFKPFEWSDQGLPIIRIQNLNGSDDFNYFSGQYNKKIEVDPEQLLFAWSGSRGTSFGPHIWHGPTAVLNYHTWKLVQDETQVDKAFFLHGLKRLTAEIEASAHGASALVHTQKKEMEGFLLPVPPLAEQQAIAEALGDADALIAGLEALIAKKRDIKNGAMQKLLTGHRRLPGFQGEWTTLRLEDACVKIQDGTHFSPKLGGADFLYLTSKNIKFGYLELSDIETISAIEHAKIYARCDTRRGDLLLTKDGARTGNAAINSIDDPISLLSSVAFLRFSSLHSADFFLQLILSPMCQKQMTEQMSGNAITRLTLQKIKSLRFTAPTLDEQRAIAAVLSDMDAEIATLKDKLAKTRAVKLGMMQVLLTGEIRLI